MHAASDKFTKEGFAKGFRNGADNMRADMMALLPDPDGSDVDMVTGRPHTRSIIKAFPDPYEHGPYYRAVMPSPFDRVSPWGSTIPTEVARKIRTVDFRPIKHAITKETPNGKASLTWFTWEPTEGSEELGEHTSALFTGMGKLGFVASLVRNCAMYSNDFRAGELYRASELLEECTEEFRRMLGKFAPISNEDERTQRERYMRRW